jgi:hypothetical protein
VPFNEIRNLTSNWQSLKVDEIRKLRSYKIWLKILEDLERIQQAEYTEFSDWKTLRSVLP